MSDPLWRNTKIKVNNDENLSGMAKQLIRLLSGQEDAEQRESYVEKLIVDGAETSVDELLAQPDFNTIEFSFEYYSTEAIGLYERLLEEVSQRGTGFGAIEYCCAHFTNTMQPYGDVRVTDVDLTSNDDEWCTEVDQAITLTVGIDELCQVLGCEPSGLWNALEDNGGSILEDLIEADLVETIFGGDEADLESYELGSDAGTHIREFAPGIVAPIVHCSLDTAEQEWNELLAKLDGPSGDSGDLILVEPSEDLDADKARLEFVPNDEMFRGAPLSDYVEYKEAFEEVAASLSERGDTIELRWEDEFSDDTNVASFAAVDGFKMLSFETGSNHWGDFEAVEYELK